MRRARGRHWIASYVAAASLLVAACSSDSPPAGAGQGGRATTGAGGAGGTATANGGATGSGGAATGSGGAGGAGGGFTRVAVCGERGTATATATTYTGFEELFMTGEEGLGSDVCVVRFDVRRVGAAPGGCTDCTWVQTLEYSNPTTPTDVDGACANSELALTAAKIAAMAGRRISIGFAREYLGAHNSVRMRYDDTMTWTVYGNATWDEATSVFRYDRRDGFCNY